MRKTWIGGALVLALLAGCGGDRASTREKARTALRRLLAYRGAGALATRKTLRWVDEIVAGGEPVLEELREAVRTAPEVSYQCPAQLDPRAGVLSNYRRLRIALLEAVARIGGEEAVRILEAASVVQRYHWEDRTAALLFLARFADRADVRAHYGELIRRALAARRDDPETVQLLRIARGRVDNALYEPLRRAVADGWPATTADEITALMADLRREDAGRSFLLALSDPKASRNTRVIAVRALGRLPEKRALAASVLLKKRDPLLTREFLRGLLQGRYGDAAAIRGAGESGDRAALRKAFTLRKADVGEGLRLAREVTAVLSETDRKKLGADSVFQTFQRRLSEVERRLEALETPNRD